MGIEFPFFWDQKCLGRNTSYSNLSPLEIFHNSQQLPALRRAHAREVKLTLHCVHFTGGPLLPLPTSLLNFSNLLQQMPDLGNQRRRSVHPKTKKKVGPSSVWEELGFSSFTPTSKMGHHKGHGLGAMEIQLQISLLLSSCVILNVCLDLSESYFPHL